MTQTATRRRNNNHQISLERAEDVLWLVTEAHEEPERACRRVGTSMDAVEQTFRRADRRPDWARIVALKPCSLQGRMEKLR